MIDIKSQVAPKGLQFNASDFFISDKYATILTVVSYPKVISPGYLSNLTSMSGIKIVIKHIPVPFSTMSKMLNKQIAELKSRYQEEKDNTIRERIRLDAESLEEFVTMLAGSQARIFDFQMHILNMRKLPEYINKESYLMIITNYNYFLTNDVINKELFENKYKSEVLSWYDNLIAVKLWGGEYKQFNILLVSD